MNAGRTEPARSTIDPTVPSDLVVIAGPGHETPARTVRDALARGLALVDRSRLVPHLQESETMITMVPDDEDVDGRALSDEDHVGLLLHVEHGLRIHIAAYPRGGTPLHASIRSLGRTDPPPDPMDEPAQRALLRDATSLAIGLIDAALDPARRLDPDKAIRRISRIDAVAIHLASADPERRPHVAFGHTLDGQPTGAPYDHDTGSQGDDVLDDARRSAWFPPAERAVEAILEADGTIMAFRPIASFAEGDASAVETLRALASLPDLKDDPS